MKRIANIKTSSDTPAWFLYEQGIRWEELRASYWAKRGNDQQVIDALSRAAHYDACRRELPHNLHRFAR